jgi:hypothetical protein
VFCPRCGAESEEGARYCASCGEELPRKKPASDAGGVQPPASSSGLTRLIGSTRNQRLITAGTGLALIVAAIAFVALKPSEETIPQDAYNKSLDADCVAHKEKIADVQQEALGGEGLEGVARFGDALVPIAGEWRADVGRGTAPADRRALVEELDTALLAVEVTAGTLGRVARESGPAETVAAAKQVDLASEQVEAAIRDLELERCERLTVKVGNLVQR